MKLNDYKQRDGTGQKVEFTFTSGLDDTPRHRNETGTYRIDAWRKDRMEHWGIIHVHGSAELRDFIVNALKQKEKK